jgi:hypothetical protein
VEAKKLTGSKGCPYCFASRASKYREKPHKLGVKFSVHQQQELSLIENEQEQMIVDHHASLETLNAHAETMKGFPRGIRPVLSFRDRLGLDAIFGLGQTFPIHFIHSYWVKLNGCWG